jgi:hypothetical protein
MQYLIGFFLAAHGLIHASYLTPAPAAGTGPRWPFEMANSWLVTGLHVYPGIVRVIGVALIVVTVVGFAVSALVFARILPAADLWLPAVVVSSVASIVLLSLFFDPWIVLGFPIDAVLLWAVLANGWQPAQALVN